MNQEAECLLYGSTRRDTVRMNPECIDPSVRFTGSHICDHFIGVKPESARFPQNVTNTCQRAVACRNQPLPG